MSYGGTCPACIAGRHDGHDATFGTRPGLIGGETCDCVGECIELHDAAAKLLWDIFTAPVPAPDPKEETR